jgi:hypothetical protein
VRATVAMTRIISRNLYQSTPEEKLAGSHKSSASASSAKSAMRPTLDLVSQAAVFRP